MAEMITTQQALQELALLLPENLRVYLLSGVVDLAQVRRQFPDADTSVPASVRRELRDLRQSVLDNDLDRGLAAKYLSGAGINSSSRILAAEGVVDRINVVRAVEDPLGRTGGEAGFGRAGEPERAAAPQTPTQNAATSPVRPPTGPLPVGQQYVFNRGTNRWELMDTNTGRSLGAVEQSGRLIPGTSPVAPTPTTPTPAPTGGPAAGIVEEPVVDVPVPADWEQAAMEQYGGYWSIFQNNPELKKLLLDATANSWAPSKFQYEIEQTDWWKTTTEAARVFDMEEATDPATVQTKIDNRVSTISQYALQFGVRISSETASQLARDSLRGGWSEQTLQTAITNEATKSTAGISQLRAGYIGQQIQASANSYGVRLGDTELNSWVQKWASGAESKESVDAAMREWSKVLYPSISTYIDQGRTFQDVVSPYKSIAAGLLELDPNQIDFTEPKWLAAISQEDKNGQQKLMSASQWQREIRTNRDFGFEFTKQAQDQAYAIANQMAELFGRV